MNEYIIIRPKSGIGDWPFEIITSGGFHSKHGFIQSIERGGKKIILSIMGSADEIYEENEIREISEIVGTPFEIIGIDSDNINDLIHILLECPIKERVLIDNDMGDLFLIDEFLKSLKENKTNGVDRGF